MTSVSVSVPGASMPGLSVPGFEVPGWTVPLPVPYIPPQRFSAEIEPGERWFAFLGRFFDAPAGL